MHGLRLFSSDAFFLRTYMYGVPGHVNSFIDEYWAHAYVNVRKQNASLESSI